MIKISYITIGTELLKGRIVNTNAAEAGILFRKHGFQLDRVLSIHDSAEAILGAVSDELARSEVVLLSGGLGPTKDDITKHTLAAWSDSELVWDASTLATIEQRYAARGRKLNPLTRAQAMVPKSCTVIPNHLGTAPGMCFFKEGKMLISMPGVPFEMLHMLEHEVLPMIQDQFQQATFRHRIIRLANIPESEAAARMEFLEDSFPPELEIAYLPRGDGLWLEASLRLDGAQAKKAEEVLQEVSDQIIGLFGPKVYATGGKSLPELMVDFFLRQNLTLSLIEEATGGGITSRMFEGSQIRQVLKGSLCLPHLHSIGDAFLQAESADPLTQFLAEWIDPVAMHLQEADLAMVVAEACRKLFGTDVGISTLGDIEKQGEQPAEIWIGYADERESRAIQYSLLYNRKVNMERVANYAMQFCLQIAEEHFG